MNILKIKNKKTFFYFENILYICIINQLKQIKHGNKIKNRN